jgi:SAM-dependent methyltransferase
MDSHDHDLARAFDGQAARFERAPVQADPAGLARLVAFAALPQGARVLDAGCGPGLVSEALLEAGHHVRGVDLSGEMVRRARQRCIRFGERARFDEGSVLDIPESERFDAALSRLVIHHVADPLAFVRRQAQLVEPGGVVVASDHVGDPDRSAAAWHQDIERARDLTHTRSLTSGELVDLLSAAGLEQLRLVEERFELDFDEWFDRGTPAQPKDVVRAKLLAGRARGFDPELLPDGAVRIRSVRALVRGVKPHP